MSEIMYHLDEWTRCEKNRRVMISAADLAYDLGYRRVATECMSIAYDQRVKGYGHRRKYEELMDEEQYNNWFSEGGN